jgi:M6 family metalloprotease-like protein
MKIIFLIVFSLVFGFSSQEIFAETEMTGWLNVVDVYSLEPVPQSYIFWFEDVDKTNYRLNPNSLPPNIMNLAGEKVSITIDDEPGILANSLEPYEEVFDVISIEKIETPGVLSQGVPTEWRSVTLLSKFLDVATTPSENSIDFNLPQGVAIDLSGNVYVADSNNHQLKRFNSNGAFTGTIGSTFCVASTGFNCEDPDGPGPLELGDGQFLFPSGVAIDSSNNFYVVDNNNHRVQKFSSGAEFLLKFGANGGNGTSGSGDGEFWFPFGVAVDSSDNVYVADYTNNRIQKFDSAGTFQGWMGRCTSGDNCDVGNSRSNGFSCTAATCLGLGGNSAGNGQFFGPRDVAVDNLDNIYVVESNGNHVQKFDSDGNFTLQFGSAGLDNGQFSVPRGIAVDSSNIYVADTGNNRVQKFNSTGGFVLKFGAFGGNGTVGTEDGQFDATEGIAVDGTGNIYVADKNNDRVQKFNSTGVFDSKIASTAGADHDAAYYQTLFYDGPGSLKQYFNASSYGHFILNGSVNGWNTLPKTHASYIEDANLMLTDAIELHDDFVDFCNPTPATNLILIFNEKVKTGMNVAFGSINNWGGSWATDDGCSITISVSWEPDHGGFFCCGQTLDRGIGVTAHEVGHNLGLLHTPPPDGTWNDSPVISDPYRDPNSVMSTNKDQEGPSALITGQRDQKGWMSAENKITVLNGTSTTITLDFINESEGGSNPQMAIVPLSNGSSYIIEAHKEELFNDTPQDRTGAIMYIHFPGGNQYSYLSSQGDKDAEYSLVATAGTDTQSQFDLAILELSETYLDNVNSVNVTTQSINSTSVTVFVSNNASSDADSDGIPDGTDNCPDDSNSGQEDLDADGIGDVCDSLNVITADTIVSSNVTSLGNLVVQNNSLLTINPGVSVTVPSGSNLSIESGSGVLIKDGGTLNILT